MTLTNKNWASDHETDASHTARMKHRKVLTWAHWVGPRLLITCLPKVAGWCWGQVVTQLFFLSCSYLSFNIVIVKSLRIVDIGQRPIWFWSRFQSIWLLVLNILVMYVTSPYNVLPVRSLVSLMNSSVQCGNSNNTIDCSLTKLFQVNHRVAQKNLVHCTAAAKLTKNTSVHVDRVSPEADVAEVEQVSWDEASLEGQDSAEQCHLAMLAYAVHKGYHHLSSTSPLPLPILSSTRWPQGHRKLVCAFANPLEIDNHNKTEAGAIMEVGKSFDGDLRIYLTMRIVEFDW